MPPPAGLPNRGTALPFYPHTAAASIPATIAASTTATVAAMTATKFPRKGVHSFVAEPYGINVHVSFDRDVATQMGKFFGADGADIKGSGGYCGTSQHSESGIFRVWMGIFTDADKHPDEWMVTAAHECLHAAYSILDVCGVEVDPDNHEALTYLHGYLFRKVIGFRAKTYNGNH